MNSLARFGICFIKFLMDFRMSILNSSDISLKLSAIWFRSFSTLSSLHSFSSKETANAARLLLLSVSNCSISWVFVIRGLRMALDTSLFKILSAANFWMVFIEFKKIDKTVMALVKSLLDRYFSSHRALQLSITTASFCLWIYFCR